MNLYISDLHFGHANVIKYDQRPFGDVEEMDHCMIELWNSRVSGDDDVFIIGDFCYRSGKTPDWYLRQLNGHKHLIIGNHDKVTTDCEAAAKYLESVDKMLFIPDGDKHISLCHFPIADWIKARHGAWHIYGHIHGDKSDVYQFMQSRERALNAAACINNYMPASFDELVRNNAAFLKENADIGTIFVAENTYTGEKFRFSGNHLFKSYIIRPAHIADRKLPFQEVDVYSMANEEPKTLNRTNLEADKRTMKNSYYDGKDNIMGNIKDNGDCDSNNNSNINKDYLYLLCVEGYEYTQVFGVFNSLEKLYKSYMLLMEKDHRCKETTKTDKPHIYKMPLNSFIGTEQQYGDDWTEYYDNIASLEITFEAIKEEIHREIVKKLGFEPRDYKYEERKGKVSWIHDDHEPSKFDGLTLFELEFMRDMNFWRD